MLKKTAFTFFMLLLSINSLRAKPELSLTGYPRPGGILFCRVISEENPEKVKVNLADYSAFLFPAAAGGWEAVIPLSSELKAGAYQLILTLDYPEGKKERLFRKLELSPHYFGSQRLSLPPEQLDKYTRKKVDEEYETLGRVLKTLSPQRIWWGDFLCPVAGETTTCFGLKRIIVEDNSSYRHKGVDLAAEQGGAIKASNTGVVLLTREDFIIHGKTVILDHGQGLLTLYIHQSQILVKVGELVKKGQTIGKVGSTGVSTGPHLHWGAYLQGESFDPFLLLKIPPQWKSPTAE